MTDPSRAPWRATGPFCFGGEVGRASGDETELGARERFDPAGDFEAFFLRVFEVAEVLLQRLIVELREEIRLSGLIELANAVDELTFVHGVFTFD